jgi:hypothetical protein
LSIFTATRHPKEANHLASTLELMVET